MAFLFYRCTVPLMSTFSQHTPHKVYLQFREEGRLWNCYLAVHGVTDKALVGSMAFGAIEKDPECKRLFMDACKRALAMAAENIGAGPITEWHEQKPSEPKGSA